MFPTKFFPIRHFNGLYFAPGLGVAIVGQISVSSPYAIILAQARIASAIKEHGAFSEVDLIDPYGVILPATFVVTIETTSPGAAVQTASPLSEGEGADTTSVVTTSTPSSVIE